VFHNVPYDINDELVSNIESLQLQVVNRSRKLAMVESQTKMLTSRIAPPKLELKLLLENLKYAYLGNDETFYLL